MIEGLNGGQMLLGLFIGLAVLFFLVLKTKVHSFVALIIATVIIGVVGGMPVNATKLADGNTIGIIKSITTMSGYNFRARRTASAPSDASPTSS